MEGASRLLTRLISAGLVMALLAPSLAMAGDGKQDAGSAQQPAASQATSQPADAGAAPAATQSQSAQPSSDQLPDSPGAVQSQTNGPAQQTATGQSQSSDPVPQSAPAQSSPQPQHPPQGTAREPLGTAAAEIESTTGVAASKPAGTAIAPAKQKRARMILIRVSALVGAGVAIGTVAALSSASPSRPPGSH